MLPPLPTVGRAWTIPAAEMSVQKEGMTVFVGVSEIISLLKVQSVFKQLDTHLCECRPAKH